VIRGGSWNNKPRNVRSANRNRNTPDNRNNNLGFRLASPPARCLATACPEPPPPRRRRVWCAGVHGVRFPASHGWERRIALSGMIGSGAGRATEGSAPSLQAGLGSSSVRQSQDGNGPTLDSGPDGQGACGEAEADSGAGVALSGVLGLAASAGAASRGQELFARPAEKAIGLCRESHTLLIEEGRYTAGWPDLTAEPVWQFITAGKANQTVPAQSVLAPGSQMRPADRPPCAEALPNLDRCPPQDCAPQAPEAVEFPILAASVAASPSRAIRNNQHLEQCG